MDPSLDSSSKNITDGYDDDTQPEIIFPLLPYYSVLNINYPPHLYNDTGYIKNKTAFYNHFGGYCYGEVGYIKFVAACLLVALGLPLTLGAIYGLYSQMRNGEVGPLYVINLLISDLFQFCCFIIEVALPDSKIIIFCSLIYDYSLLASVGFMVCIALERYLVIVHPLWYRCRRTIKTSVLICALVWILPAVVVHIERFSGDFRVAFVISTIFFLLPLPLLVFFLVATLKALSASISVPTEEKHRIAGMLILVLLIYLLLFLPAIIMFGFLHDVSTNPNANPNPHSYPLFNLAPMFLKLSPLADLVLYMLLRKGIIRQLSACVCRCRKESNETSAVAVSDVNMFSVPSCHLMQRKMEREGETTEGEV